MLYLMITSPASNDIRSLVNLLTTEDELLLLQDGVYAALQGSIYSQPLISLEGVGRYVLKEDLIARGLLHKVEPVFQIIEYAEFVNLTVKHTQQLTW